MRLKTEKVKPRTEYLLKKNKMEERDWWNYGINPITGYKIDNKRDPVEEERKYHMQSYGYKRE